MERRKFLHQLGGISGMVVASSFMPTELKAEEVRKAVLSSSNSGVWKYTIGKPEKITPQCIRKVKQNRDGLNSLPVVEDCPVKPVGGVTERGVLIKLPLKKDEVVYGLGLQLQSFQQRSKKKMLRVNADPKVDTGDSHAPVPFYVTTSGYGILIDTARYATFYLGNKKRKPKSTPVVSKPKGNDGWNAMSAYERMGLGESTEVLIDIPRAEGVDVYVFGGPTMLQAVQRYNLFSGGGVLPPRWGLGFWYRVQTDFNQQEVKEMAGYFRENKIPCDVIGLEPHWQSHAYSCSYVWSDKFPNPGRMVQELKDEHFRVNLWEHAFVNPISPIYKSLLPYSGDYEVWDGLVPDFISEKGKQVFADFHVKEHVDLGVSGYKADECDNSDFTGNWSFPEISQFPSGADGEQMHSVFGLQYQDTLLSAFNQKKERTYGLVRSSGALASSYPFVLYSDLYDHRVYIHAIAQSGFSGLLWTPEVRHAHSDEDLIRRLQTAIFSPLAMVNAWYLKNVPWKQINRKENNENHFANNWRELEARCRKIIELRMKLIPYIHSAFVTYQRTGLPPFRAMVMDYPDDKYVQNISNQFLVGQSMLVAPVVENEVRRKVYLPEGDWYHLWSSKRYKGKSTYEIEVLPDEVPVFIKSGTILPLAQPTLHTDDPNSWKLTAMVFGENIQPATLYEDDGDWNPELREVKLTWNGLHRKGKLERQGKSSKNRYSVKEWKMIS